MRELEVMSGMTEWRQQHAKATLREIEAELDERIAVLRAKMLEDAIGASGAVDWGVDEGPTCRVCGERMVKGGSQKRELTTLGGKQIEVKRQYARCPACGMGFFPPG